MRVAQGGDHLKLAVRRDENAVSRNRVMNPARGEIGGNPADVLGGKSLIQHRLHFRIAGIAPPPDQRRDHDGHKRRGQHLLGRAEPGQLLGNTIELRLEQIHGSALPG